MNRSFLYAAGILALLSLYMLTGIVGCSGDDRAASETAMADIEGKPVMTVRVRESRAEEIAREITVAGRTIPARSVNISAEVEGEIIEIGAARGSYVKKDDLIARIDPRDLAEERARAAALLEQRRIEYDAAKRLRERDLQSEGALAAAFVNLKIAEQALSSVELRLENTGIRAPFDGILQERNVELGDFATVGRTIAHLIEIDPIVVRGDVTELEVVYVHPGESGQAVLSNGRQVEGTIRYVAAEANEQTRTFRAELEVPNPEHSIPAGVSADIRIETERVMAHRVSLALISIADDGRFGVKHVDADNVVRFVEADIVRSSPQAVWLAGLPETIDLITVGQGFTKPGDLVKTEPDTSTWN